MPRFATNTDEIVSAATVDALERLHGNPGSIVVVSVQYADAGDSCDCGDPAGSIVGASAYDIGVANGFVGTQPEWLESLKGDPAPSELHLLTVAALDLTGENTPAANATVTLDMSAASRALIDCPATGGLTLDVSNASTSRPVAEVRLNNFERADDCPIGLGDVVAAAALPAAVPAGGYLNLWIIPTEDGRAIISPIEPEPQSDTVYSNNPSGGAGTEQFGHSANASGIYNTAIGSGATATYQQGVAIGSTTQARTCAVAVGHNTSATGGFSVAVGQGATTTGSLGVVIGYQATSSQSESVVIGAQATVTAGNSTAVGRSASAGLRSAAYGKSAQANATNATAIGVSTTTADYGTAVGYGSIATGPVSSLALGVSASATQQNAISIGLSAAVPHARALAIGGEATTTANNQAVLGGKSFAYYQTLVYGQSDHLVTGAGFTEVVHRPSKPDTNQTDLAALDHVFEGGRSSGTGDPGAIILRTWDNAGVSGTTIGATSHDLIVLKGDAVYLPGLPTADPVEADRLWNDGGNPRLSAAPAVLTGDFYVDPVNGDDSNDGTSRETAWQTLGKINTRVAGLADGSPDETYVILAGDHAGNITAQRNATLDLTYEMEPGCTITPASGTSGIAVNGSIPGSGNTLRVTVNLRGAVFFGNSVSSANGIGTTNGPILTVNGLADDGTMARFQGFDDGFSCHGQSGPSSDIVVNDCWFSGGTKSAYAHVNDSAAEAYRCVFEAAPGATIGVGAVLSTQRSRFVDCTFIPATAGQVMNMNRSDFVRCQIGTPDKHVNFGAQANSTYGRNPTLTDCYVHGDIDGFAESRWTRCYGTIRGRQRGVASEEWSMHNCVWLGNATLTQFLYSNYDAEDGNWLGGTATIRDTIVTGYAEAFDAGTAGQNAQINNEWTLDSLCLYGNGTNFDAGITNGTTGLVTADPLIGSADSTSQADYETAVWSPCRNAGSARDHIGVPSRD